MRGAHTPSRSTQLTHIWLSTSRRMSIVGLTVFLVATQYIPLATGATSESATLPPTASSVARSSHSAILAKAKTILGPAELVAFISSQGLCVEVDHVPQGSHAGGCAFLPLSAHRQIAPSGEGYADGLKSAGVTEIFGQVGLAVRSVLVRYKLHGRWHRRGAMLGRLPAAIAHRAEPLALRWFAVDLPGCLEGGDVHLLAFSARHVFLGSADALSQHAACQAGGGYKIRGGLAYGSLPSL
jgi:hypothetical protein